MMVQWGGETPGAGRAHASMDWEEGAATHGPAPPFPIRLARGGRVSLLTDERLHQILRRSFPRLELLPCTPEAFYGLSGRCDFYSLSWDLFGVLRPTPASFAHQPHGWLRADPYLVERWRRHLRGGMPGPRVGFVWRGGSTPEEQRHRGPAPEAWAEVLRTPGVVWVDLQHGERAEELAWLRDLTGVELVPGPDPVSELDDHLALLDALDLVISIDGTAGQLRAALGREAWIALARVPDPRWATGAGWYPAARTYRQDRPGGWVPVLAAIARDLRRRAGGA